LNKVYLISLVFLFSNLIYSEKDESLELLYQKIEILEQEIKNLRNLLEENSILVDRSLELQQQRYLDLDARILEISKLKNEFIPISEDDALIPIQEDTDLYKQALTLFEESRYAEALEIFSEIIISYPDGSFAPEAYFWSGELFLAQEMFEDAKISYQNVTDQFPDHQRSQDSLFKLAEIYRIEGDLELAISLYNRVINEFPDTGASQLSKKSKENLKEESNLVE
jgi:tol-pal system protein YbgF